MLLFLASVVVFLMIHLVPGDPVAVLAGDELSPTEMARLRAELGLDRPLPVQYVDWFTDLVTGDMGRSLITDLPVARLIGQSWLPTLQLSIAGAVIAALLALSTGTAAARWEGRLIDRVISGWNALQISVPGFWVGIISILLFGLVLGWLPPGGYVAFGEDPLDFLRHLVLPATVLGVSMAAVLSRFTRSAVLETLGEDYIRTARAKGVREIDTMRSHALPNALVPVVTIFGIQFGHLLGGTVIFEKVFSWPGLGTLVIQSIITRDYPVVQACLMVLVAIFLLVNLVTDIAYGVIDPRIRTSEAAGR